eukprot:1894772-Prymnesium_polylepis.1
MVSTARGQASAARGWACAWSVEGPWGEVVFTRVRRIVATGRGALTGALYTGTRVARTTGKLCAPPAHPDAGANPKRVTWYGCRRRPPHTKNMWGRRTERTGDCAKDGTRARDIERGGE